MRTLWAPWRMAYIRRPAAGKCFICRALRERRDSANLVLYRGARVLVMMNRFPYNNGHLLLAPRRHVGRLEALTRDESTELFLCLQQTVAALKAALRPAGFNVGLNLGPAAGAGLTGHLHLHVVPRWAGDTNFMPVSGATKVISQALKQTYQQLRPEFRQKSLNNEKRVHRLPRLHTEEKRIRRLHRLRR